MDNSQLIDIFMSRGLVDQYLADDILMEVENSGKEVAEILTDYEVIQNRRMSGRSSPMNLAWASLKTCFTLTHHLNY